MSGCFHRCRQVRHQAATALGGWQRRVVGARTKRRRSWAVVSQFGSFLEAEEAQRMAAHSQKGGRQGPASFENGECWPASAEMSTSGRRRDRLLSQPFIRPIERLLVGLLGC